MNFCVIARLIADPDLPNDISSSAARGPSRRSLPLTIRIDVGDRLAIDITKPISPAA
jgi:hypothetical protein